MTTLTALATDGLDTLRQFVTLSTDGVDETSSTPSLDDDLRLLALLNPMLRQLGDHIAAGVAPSPVRASLAGLLFEDLARTVGRAQILAAGKIEESDAHTLMEEPLASLHELHTHLGEFVHGATTPPADRRHAPGTKPLFKDATEMLKDLLHLDYGQAKQRLSARDLLVPRRGFNGATLAPRFDRLAQVFNDCIADPWQVAATAGRLLTLKAGIDAQPNPQESAERIESQLAESLAARNPTGTGKLFKTIATGLDATALEESEARMEENFGLEFKSKQARGFVWEICTDIIGHELLTGINHQLANPRTQFGSTPEASSSSDPGTQSDAGQADGTDLQDEDATTGGATIPAWAVDPDTPAAELPRAGFTDVGQSNPASGQSPGDPLPVRDIPPEARNRERSRKLLQYLFDSLRGYRDGDRGPGPGMPARPHMELIVTIPLDSLTGKLDAPGVTGHNHLLSAAYARRLACSANVIPAVLGTESQPLDLGRKQRFFNRAQRRALLLRDKGCINPGCTMAAHRCEVNHINPWYLGGKTNLENAALLCPTCHAAFHAGHFQIVVIDSLPYVLQNKALDPEQRLRRNWIFHPEALAAA